MTKISAQAARDLEPGGVLYDHVVKGLQLRARGAVKSWHFYYRVKATGAERRPKIGEFPAYSLEMARKHASELYEAVRRGEDPSGDLAARRAAPAVSDLCDDYLEHLDDTAKNKPRTLEEKRRNIKLHVRPQLGKLKVADVKLSDVDDRLKEIAASSGETAARIVRALLSNMFRFAEHDDRRWRPRDSNPVRDARRFGVKRRRRHIEGDEAPKVAEELDKLAATYPQRVAALWCILLAGTRITELCTARRSHLRENTLILTEHKTDRTGNERVIVLPRQALALIETLPDDGSGYLFGAELGNVDGRDTARFLLRHVWTTAREAAGCPDLRMQDFRRTFASAAKSAGKSLDVVGELFGHGSVETTRGYSWLFDESAAAAAQDTADELEKRMRKRG